MTRYSPNCRIDRVEAPEGRGHYVRCRAPAPPRRRRSTAEPHPPREGRRAARRRRAAGEGVAVGARGAERSDRREEVERGILAGDVRVVEPAAGLFHRGNDEVVPGLEVHVEGAACEAGALADGVEARRIEPLLAEGGDGGVD